MKKILVLDKQNLFWDALQVYLDKEGAKFSVQLSESITAALNFLSEGGSADLILVNPVAYNTDLKSLLNQIKKVKSDPYVALFCDPLPRSQVKEAMKVGLCGYLPRTMSGETFISAVNFMLSGEKFMPFEEGETTYFASENRPQASSFGQVQEAQIAWVPYDEQEQVKARTLQQKITPRQREVLIELAQGKPNKEIGSTLGITEVTVKQHISAMMSCTGARNRIQLVNIAKHIVL